MMKKFIALMNRPATGLEIMLFFMWIPVSYHFGPAIVRYIMGW